MYTIRPQCGHLTNIPIQNHRHYNEVCCYNNHFCKGFSLHFGMWVWGFALIQPQVPGAKSVLKFISKVFRVVEVRALGAHLRSSTSTLANHVFMELTLYTEALSCWNRFSFSLRKNPKATTYKNVLSTLW